MRAISLFSGAGGMDVGFDVAGVETRLSVEMDPVASSTLRSFSKGDVVTADVRSVVSGLVRGSADLVYGGPPCQGFSFAGRMNAADERNDLVGTYLDAVEAIRPKAFVMENVDALLRLAKWRDVVPAIATRMAAVGYGVHARICNAADYGVAQARRRTIVWGVLGMPREEVGTRIERELATLAVPHVPARRVLMPMGRAGTSDNPATCRARINFAARPTVRRSPWAGYFFNGAGRAFDLDAPAPTIAAATGGNNTHIVDEEALHDGAEAFVVGYHAQLAAGEEPSRGAAPSRLRRLTLRESAALQGFPSAMRFEGSTNAVYRQIGNAVPPPMAEAVASAVLRLL